MFFKTSAQPMRVSRTNRAAAIYPVSAQPEAWNRSDMESRSTNRFTPIMEQAMGPNMEYARLCWRPRSRKFFPKGRAETSGLFPEAVFMNRSRFRPSGVGYAISQKAGFIFSKAIA